MLTFEQRQEFYKTSKIILKDNPQWRLYKIQLENECWITIKNQIRSSEQLRKILIEKAPINVFSSCSTWLNPLRIEHPHYVYADRLFLNNDIFIDMDHHDKYTYNATIDWFEQAGYKLLRTVDSGNGYHQYYRDIKTFNEPNPLERYKNIENNRKELVNYLKETKLDLDYNMTQDLERISRVIGTLNDGEKVCSLIYDSRLGNGSERFPTDEIQKPAQNNYWEAPPGPSASLHIQTWCWKFIDSFVEGTKDRYCVFIRKHKRLYDLTKFKKKLRHLQYVYDLPEFYIYETHNTFEAICPKALPYRRVVKILKKARSKNLSSFLKYKHSWIRTSNIIDYHTLDILKPKPKLVYVLESPGNGDLDSRPHLHYLKALPKRLLTGRTNNRIKIAMAKIPIKKNDVR